MNTRNTLITLVIGFVLLITACNTTSTTSTPTPAPVPVTHVGPLGPNRNIHAWSGILLDSAPIEIKNGDTLNVFGVDFTFVDETGKPVRISWDEFKPFSEFYLASLHQSLRENPDDEQAMAMLIKGGDIITHHEYINPPDGRIVFTQGDEYIVVKVINSPTK